MKRRHGAGAAAVRIRRIGRGGGYHVFVVDGEKIRDRIDVDWTMGGTHARWAFIPRGEIWVDRNLSPRDRAATIAHERAEGAMMAHGAPYGRAHDAANRSERRWRARHHGR